MEYRNITLEFQQSAADGLVLRLSGAGEATEPVDFSKLTELASEAAAGDADCWQSGGMRNLRRIGAALDPLPEETGRRLFDALFVGRLRELLCSQLGALDQPDRGLRLRLALDINLPRLRRLQNLPWELLWFPAWQSFFALDRRISLVRSLDVPRPCTPFSAIDTIHCLVATASPEGLEKLDLGEEVERIKQALEGQQRIAASYLPSAGPQSIRDRLLKPPANILHFAGHGYDDGDLGLVLESGSNKPFYFEAARWAEQVSDLKLRLVVLNACSTAVPSSCATQPFHGVAQALIRAGIPAVVAMRQPIPDHAGLIFAHIFYGRLAAGDPVDAALVEARKALRAELPMRSLDWTIPALFLRGEDGGLFAESIKSEDKPVVASGDWSDIARVHVAEMGDGNELTGNERLGSGSGSGRLWSDVRAGRVGNGNKIVGNFQRS